MQNIGEKSENLNELVVQIRELINAMRSRPQMYLEDMKLDYIYHFIFGYLMSIKVNGKESVRGISFARYMFYWILEWIVKNIDASYKPKDFHWHHIIYEVTNSEDEAVELFFKISDEIFHEVSEAD